MLLALLARRGVAVGQEVVHFESGKVEHDQLCVRTVIREQRSSGYIGLLGKHQTVSQR